MLERDPLCQCPNSRRGPEVFRRVFGYVEISDSLTSNYEQNRSNNKSHQFWRQDNHPIELSTNWLMDQKLAYIHNNPVEAGIVDEPESYLYSSARDYSGRRGLIEINFIEG